MSKISLVVVMNAEAIFYFSTIERKKKTFLQNNKGADADGLLLTKHFVCFNMIRA